MITRTKKKTVQFFEVVAQDGTRLAQPYPWPEILADLAKQPAADCKHVVAGVDHWGRVYTYEEEDHFILVRLVEEGVSSFDISTESFIDIESNAANPYVELSIAKFLPNSNIFGFVLGSNGSSRVGSMERWINAHKMFQGEVAIVPLVSKRALDKIRAAEEAKLLTVRLDQDHVSSIGTQSGLYSVLKDIEESHGSVDIELTIRAKGRVDEERREERMGIVRTAKSMIRAPFSRAVVELVNYDSKGKPHIEKVDFLNHLLATKMNVSVTDKEGNPVRIPSAISAINKAAEKLRVDLADS